MIITTTHEKMRKMACDWISVDEKNIVEIGCNTGNFASLLYERGITNYTGIDIQKDKIKIAKSLLLKMNFICCDILKNKSVLEAATTVAAFQCLEHIENDIEILKSIKIGTTVIISVPNSPYKGHVRWFELDGWADRFSPYIDIEKSITIQNPKKPNKRAFLFKGNRNNKN